MKIAFFEPTSGASGDMILGALVDAGAPIDELVADLHRVPLSGFTIDASPVRDGVVEGTRIAVHVDENQPFRTWKSIRGLLESSAIDERAREMALAIFASLATAEATAHNVPVDDVHFHEVGAVDSIVDIVGTAIALSRLEISAVYCGGLRTGYGMTDSQHGTIPVPAPATALMLQSTNAPLLGMHRQFAALETELLTPTGAAILTTLADFSRPSFDVGQIATGFGSKTLPWPNALRVWIGTAREKSSPGDETILVMETNIDDMNPQAFELLSERLFDAGALDVWFTPIMMKKHRPGTKVSALVSESTRQECEQVFLLESTTLGVRVHPVDRTVADRAFSTVATRYGDVTVKLKIWQDHVIDTVPEYDDCAALARTANVPIATIMQEARRLAEPRMGMTASNLNR